MAEEPSKYASNQFEVVTRGRFPLMSEILTDTRPRVVAANNLNADFVGVLGDLDSSITVWDLGETRLANAGANVPARTFAFEDKLDSLTRKPDADTNSLIETWDISIRGQVAYQGPTYMLLMPQGRETITVGSYDERLDAGRDLGIRLSQQAGKPVLIALGVTITAFFVAARALRVAQLAAMAELDDARVAQETLRKQCAANLFAIVGVGMTIWSATPLMVDTLFDVALLRGGTQTLPEAPTDTTWTPSQRILATTVMPEGATRLAAWREGPGGTPEQLAVGEIGALSVLVPANITFDVGELYQLWLVGVNSQGQSEPGPKQNWTAV